MSFAYTVFVRVHLRVDRKNMSSISACWRTRGGKRKSKIKAERLPEGKRKTEKHFQSLPIMSHIKEAFND